MAKQAWQWWVPVGSFGIALFLSSLAGPSIRAFGLRAPGGNTAACTLEIKNLSAVAQARGWFQGERGSGKVKAFGGYQIDTNCGPVELTETLSIFIEKLTITNDLGETATGSAFGTVADFSASFTGPDSDPSQLFNREVGGGPDGIVGDDGSGVDRALQSTADQINAGANLGAPIHFDADGAREKLSDDKQLEVKLTIKALGTLTGVGTCPGTHTSKAKIKLNEGDGSKQLKK